MGTEWIYTTVGDFCPFTYGKGLPENKRNLSGNIAVYGSNGIVGKHDAPFVGSAGIIIGRKGTVGAVHYSGKPFWPIDTTFFISDEPRKRDLRFTYYLLKGLGLEQMNSDSAVPGLNRDAAHLKGILVPPLPEQRTIAHILGTLDDKIEVNRQTNVTLEKIAQALFKHWFIDFEFPNEKGEPYKSNGGEMVDSELGEIPEAWEVKEIIDCGKVVCGKTPSTQNKEYYGENIPFITIPDMRDKVFAIKTEKLLSEAGGGSQNKKELPRLAVCVSCIATPGLVSLTSERSHTNQQINSIICNEGVSPYFMFFEMKNKSEDIKSMGLGGTATLNLNTGDFAKIKIVVPDPKVMTKFHNLSEPLFNGIENNMKEVLSLSALRDSLLPRLMSGKLEWGWRNEPHHNRIRR